MTTENNVVCPHCNGELTCGCATCGDKIRDEGVPGLTRFKEATCKFCQGIPKSQKKK